MSKKLVKTAKQQFEERLRELGLLDVWKVQGACGRIGTFVWDNDSIVIFVHEDDDDKYSEFFYPPFEELREDETFCKECLKEFACNSDDRFVASLVRWIVDNGERPLDPEDVYFPANHLKYLESHDFEDLYEEVEEPKVLTAREKWDAASVVAKTLWSNDVETVKVEQTESFVRFYRADDILSCYEYPSLEEMRKDETFSIRIMEVLVESCQTEHLGKFLNWVRRGGAFPLPIEIIFHSEYQVYKFTEYEDDRKESPKKNFKDEIDALRKKMVEYIIQLCEQGMTVNVDSLTKRIALGWEDNSFVFTEDIKDLFAKKAENGEWLFCYTSYPNGRSDEYPFKYLSIETLQMFIEAMQ